jgi:hypothetical protein
MPSSRALCGSVYRAQTLTGLIGCGAPTSRRSPRFVLPSDAGGPITTVPAALAARIEDALRIASTFRPRRDLALRYAESSAPDPFANTARKAKHNARSELSAG